MIGTSAWLSACALLLAAFVAEADVAQRPIILFEVLDERDGKRTAEPIAMLREGRIEEVPVVYPIDESPEQFDRAKRANDALALLAFPKDALLTVLAAGRPVGQLSVLGDYHEDGVQPGGCMWFSLPVAAAGHLARSASRTVLAMNGAAEIDTGFVPGEPSIRADKLLVTTANRLFRKLGVADQLLPRMKRERAVAYRRANDREDLLVASFAIEMFDETSDRLHALLMVFERTGGGLTLTHHAYRFGINARIESEDIIDLVDLDGDGRPEIVTKIRGYESWTYAIYRKHDRGWHRVYEGGGGGC